MSDSFTFLHAADLHIDSPLLGLSRKSPVQARQVADASRAAFENLINLAIEEKCRFVLLAGDLFDGDWKDYRTGTVFVAHMRRLEEAGIDVYIILGNHDAENRFVSRLELSNNVHLFKSKSPQSLEVPGLPVVVHGVSYAQRDVDDNLAATYPAPTAGRFNIGILHTACEGRAGHARYAPCTLEQLVSHGYDYWALGHVHAREVLNENPLIIYPGNLQGRNPRETGPKGATIVRVSDGKIESHEHHALDVVRWDRRSIDLTALEARSDVLQKVKSDLAEALESCEGRSLVVRLVLTGETELHPELTADRTTLVEDIETIAASLSDELWVEKVQIATTPGRVGSALDPSVVGRLEVAIDEASEGGALAAMLETIMADVRVKFPAAAHLDLLNETILESSGRQARQLAKAVLARASKS